MRGLPLLLTGLLACGPSNPNPGPGTTTGTTGTTITTPPTTGPRPPGSDFGSLMLVRKANQLGETTEVEFVGVFPTSNPGFLNLAQCARLGGTCLPQLPDTEDDFIDIDPERTFDFAGFDYAFVGTSVRVGPLTAWYQNGALPHYYANYTEEYGIEDIDGTYGVTIGGEWGDYEGYNDIVLSPMMNVMSHDAGQNMPFHDGQTLVFEWEPQGSGEVFLTMHGGVLSRMWLLEDDGYFELSADSLGLGTEEVDLKVNLSRWNYGEVDVDGNELSLVDVSEVAWSGTYFYVGGRDMLIPADTCGETNTMPEYLTGQYWGRLADWGYNNSLNPSYGGCTGYLASGEDGFIKFDLPPRTFLSITHELLTDDASLYIVEDCNDDDTCLVGSDVSIGNGPESVQFFNGLDIERTVYGVLDGWTSSAGLFYADITVTVMGPPDMYDTCTAVTTNQLVPTGAGGYYSDITAYTNQLDPATGGCTPIPAPGPDSMTKVELQSGETLTVNIDMQGADPSLYLLYTCTNTNSCAAGVDQSVGANEQLIYQNASGSTETLYLVVDTKTQMQPYFMTIDIQ